MTWPRQLAAATVLAVTLGAGPAGACSPGPGFRVQTNLELARDANSILIGQVVDGDLDEDDPEASTITVHPLRMLKGEMPSGDLALSGMMLSRDVGRESAGLSDPFEFEAAHPVSYWGACIRYVFPQGTTVLFFLDQGTNGEWQPAGGPFSRWAEDIPGEDAPWVQLTELYLSASELPEEDRKEALLADRDRLISSRNDPTAQLMAADIDRALGASTSQHEGPFTDAAEAESTVDSTLERMRSAAIEGGN